MSKLDRYNEYCVLVSNLNTKTIELNELSTRRNRLVYEIESMKKELEDFRDISDISSKEMSSLKRVRMRQCFSPNNVINYEEGGSLGENSLLSFKKSKEYKELTAEEKRLFKKIEGIISDTQYNLQNAILVGQADESDFDVYDSNVIEDYIDESMSDISDYEEISTKNLKKIKQIMYKFVEQVSKI